MKIAFYTNKSCKDYANRIISSLKEYAPRHEYIHHIEHQKSDIWHCLAPSDSFALLLKADRSIISLYDLRFIHSPHLFSLSDRLFKLPLYRYHCRHAARLIARNSSSKEYIVEALGLDRARVEVSLPMAMAHSLLHESATPSRVSMLELRSRLNLPQSFLLVVGEMDTAHSHTTILHSIFEQRYPLDVVIVGRHTTHADTLLRVVRDNGAATHIQFIYECAEGDLSLLYSMALCVIFLPTFEASVEPIIKALTLHTPMILSETPLNRETAQGAALYVDPHSVEELSLAIKEMLYNESFRGQLIAQSVAEARRFEERSIAEELSKIYESV